MSRLKNKISLVTGAADGIGFQVARAFSGEGAAVALLDHNADKLTAAADSIAREGGRVLPLICDVSETGSMRQAVEQCLDEFGRIDVLVNNAAVAISGDITDQSDEDWWKLLNINLLGVFRGIRFVLPQMLERKSGSVINMASIQGDRSWAHWTTYAAAKGGVKAATRQLAGQYGSSGVRFNCISPGAILTPMNEKRAEAEGPGFLDESARMHALGRMGRADEINGTAVFLASDESSFVTGEDLLVDGGLSVLPKT